MSEGPPEGGAGGHPAGARTLLHRQGLVTPIQARRSLAWTMAVPPGTPALRLRLAFRPDRSAGVRNLLTLSLFDPHGFRGAGHRHLPRQEVLLSPAWATPGFVAGPLPGGEWTVEIDVHCALPSEEGGVELRPAGGRPPRRAARPPRPPLAPTLPALLRRCSATAHAGPRHPHRSRSAAALAAG